MLGRPGRLTLGMVSTLVLLGAISGCGLLSGTTHSPENSTGRVEKSTVTVGLMPIIDVAPVHIALKKGYFAEEGLTIESRNIQGGAAGIPGLASGDLDFSIGNWVSFFLAQSKGIDLKLVSDGYQARQRMFMIMTVPGSSVRVPADLAGKKVALNTMANITELTARSTLDAYGVDPKTVVFKEFPYPDMHAQLARKSIDAALMIEPFITHAERVIGAVPVVDTAAGPTQDIPIAGYATNAKFARENPKTVAAFQRALQKGQADANRRGEVEAVLPGYARIDPQTASLVHFGSYPMSLEQSRLQRVVELMKIYGMLSQNQQFDFRSMIVAQ
ncbi:ABC transporter substrate-binding protein [Allokutzneria albata]|uniref:NitT/TauT family transport system substrate-binding protein n=1 Tax=Allokutzneria albata TaxID=211114 RepID=A0A1G9UXR6_ALLAB|nr:ABC transporter substrate-binding protein [Allokutzneria albata]SDM64596.1 NitT/TauT family transport system substrate-binding protein [Allokutzneria albata]